MPPKVKSWDEDTIIQHENAIFSETVDEPEELPTIPSKKDLETWGDMFDLIIAPEENIQLSETCTENKILSRKRRIEKNE